MKRFLSIVFTLSTFVLQAQVPAGYSPIYSKSFETSLKAGEYLKKDAWYFYMGSNVTSYSSPELDKRFIIKPDPKNASNKALEIIKFQYDKDYSNKNLNPRSELSFRPSLERSTNKEIYFQLKTYFPLDQKDVFSAEFIQFWVHGTTGNDTDIPLQIEVRNGNFGARLPRSPGFVTPFTGKKLSSYLDKWITWEVRAKFSNNNGYWKIYMNGELVFTYSGPTNYWPGSSGTWHPQFGAYANIGTAAGDMRVYFDDFIVAEKTSAVVDCNGTPNGTAKIDACGVCSGGTTGIAPSSPVNWYADADNDGKGDPSVVKLACSQPAGYVADKSDLCPSDKNKTSPGNCGCGIPEGTCGNNLPVVSFLTPASSSVITAPGDLYVKVDASDADGAISKVVLYINNQLVRQENLAPYEWGAAGQNDPLIKGLAAGTYVLKAVATDNSGGSSASSISVTVKSPSTSTTGINGPACVNAGTTVSYSLVPENTNYTSVNYWSNSGAVITKDAADDKKLSIEFPGYTNGTTITLTAGVNFPASPWYKEYTMNIKVGNCTQKVSAVITPQPTESSSILTLEGDHLIKKVIIFNSIGEIVYQTEIINSSSVELGNGLATGIYTVQINSSDGVTVTKFYKR